MKDRLKAYVFGIGYRKAHRVVDLTGWKGRWAAGQDRIGYYNADWKAKLAAWAVNHALAFALWLAVCGGEEKPE
jgi:hypothetical protein